MGDNNWEYEALRRAQTVGRERLNPNRARSVFIPGSNAEVQLEAEPQSDQPAEVKSVEPVAEPQASAPSVKAETKVEEP
jgi:hypothetical protein